MTERATWEILREQIREEVLNPTVAKQRLATREPVQLSYSFMRRMGTMVVAGGLAVAGLAGLHVTSGTAVSGSHAPVAHATSQLNVLATEHAVSKVTSFVKLTGNP